MKKETEQPEIGGANACESCTALALDISEPSYTEGMALCPDCEAYYGVADDSETRKPEKVGHLCEGCEAILVIPESNIWATCPECGVTSWCEDHTAESFATRVVVAEVEEL